MRLWTIVLVHASTATMLMQGIVSTHKKYLDALVENTTIITWKGKVVKYLKLLVKAGASYVPALLMGSVSAASELVVQSNLEENPTAGLRSFFTQKNI